MHHLASRRSPLQGKKAKLLGAHRKGKSGPRKGSDCAHRAVGGVVDGGAGRVGGGVEHVGRQRQAGLIGLAGAHGGGRGRVQHWADGVHHPCQAGRQAHHIQPMQAARVVLHSISHNTHQREIFWLHFSAHISLQDERTAWSMLMWLMTDKKQQKGSLLWHRQTPTTGCL